MVTSKKTPCTCNCEAELQRQLFCYHGLSCRKRVLRHNSTYGEGFFSVSTARIQRKISGCPLDYVDSCVSHEPRYCMISMAMIVMASVTNFSTDFNLCQMLHVEWMHEISCPCGYRATRICGLLIGPPNLTIRRIIDSTFVSHVHIGSSW